MKSIARTPEYRTQRVRVGLIGLAAVLLLIGLASAVFSTLNRDRPVSAIGSARPDVVANMVDGNSSAPSDFPSNSPLSELGIAPSTQVDNSTTAAGMQRRR